VLLALVVDLLLRGRDTQVTGWITLLGVGFTLYFVCSDYPEAETASRAFGLLVHDSFAMLMKLLLGSALFVVLLYSVLFRGLERDGVGEYYAVMCAAVLGAFFLVSTDNLLMMFLGLETLSISSYVLAGFLKREKRGAEAAMKYLVYGILSSGTMLYGFSLLYGYTGSLDLTAMGEGLRGTLALAEGGLPAEGIGVAVAVMMVLVGFGYKIAAFPFHFWSPDVYEGAPLPVTTFLAVISKAASFGMVLRFFGMVFPLTPDATPVLGQTVALIAALSMTFGNIAAMLQDNAKRLLAYSSIAHSGYLLMGVAAMLTPDRGQSINADYYLTGSQAVLFYLVAYAIMNLGAFGVVIYLSNRFGIESVSRYRGLGWKAPTAAAMMTIFLLSLTGIPPTIGFIGKWFLFLPVINKGMIWLAAIAGINSVVSLFYYFRIVKALFLRPEEEAEPSPRRHAYSFSIVTVLSVLGFLTVALGLSFQTLSDLVLSIAV
jgi:NADH-quinone oxidoreductase subunit N